MGGLEQQEHSTPVFKERGGEEAAQQCGWRAGTEMHLLGSGVFRIFEDNIKADQEVGLFSEYIDVTSYPAR